MSAQAINSRESQIPEPNISRVLFADTRLVPVWLLIRVYLGALWLVAGWEKLTDPAGLWVGSKAGAAVAGFAQGAMAQTTGEHPQVTGWYASFLKDVVVPNAALSHTWSPLVRYWSGSALSSGCSPASRPSSVGR